MDFCASQELGGSTSSRRDDSTGRRSAKGSAPGSVSGLAIRQALRVVPRCTTGAQKMWQKHTKVIICGVWWGLNGWNLHRWIVQNLFLALFDFDPFGFQFYLRPSTPRWCFSRSASICCGRSGGVSQRYPSAMVAWDRVWHSGCMHDIHRNCIVKNDCWTWWKN